MRRRYRRTDIGDEIHAYFDGLAIGRATLDHDPGFAPLWPVLACPFDDQMEWNAEIIGMWDAVADRADDIDGGCFA